jgi:hypothetical protein
MTVFAIVIGFVNLSLLKNRTFRYILSRGAFWLAQKKSENCFLCSVFFGIFCGQTRYSSSILLIFPSSKLAKADDATHHADFIPEHFTHVLKRQHPMHAPINQSSNDQHNYN